VPYDTQRFSILSSSLYLPFTVLSPLYGISAVTKYAGPAIVFPARKKAGNPELAKLSLVFPFYPGSSPVITAFPKRNKFCFQIRG
jgi:hypothetical protein